MLYMGALVGLGDAYLPRYCAGFDRMSGDGAVNVMNVIPSIADVQLRLEW